MDKVVFILLILTGLTNLVPVVGVISAEQLSGMYSVSIDSPDLGVLMRHRAVMLGLIGAFLIVAAFRPSLRIAAASIGLISMATFVLLAFTSGEIGTDVRNVALVDIAGSVMAAAVLVISIRDKGNHE
ncbi:MAG: phosphopantetheine adenylyltransferase [Woeseiaceae bacterium]